MNDSWSRWEKRRRSSHHSCIASRTTGPWRRASIPVQWGFASTAAGAVRRYTLSCS